MFYDVLLSYLQGRNIGEKVSFPQLTLYIGVQVMYVFVSVCRCVRTSVHVTKPPLTQSMTPFFLSSVLHTLAAIKKNAIHQTN